MLMTLTRQVTKALKIQTIKLNRYSNFVIVFSLHLQFNLPEIVCFR